jgi:histidyl-tRNA synthetase
MNIFVLDEDPAKAARMLCDAHVVKMIVESAQLLSTHERLLFVYNNRAAAEDLCNYLTESSGFNEWYGVKEVSLLE